MHQLQSKPSEEVQNAPLCERWAKVTGWHGVLDAYWSKSCVWKLLWIATLVLSALAGLNQCVSKIIDCISDDRWTSTITMRPAESLPVPTLYVCNLNVYNQTALAENGITADNGITAERAKNHDHEERVRRTTNMKNDGPGPHAQNGSHNTTEDHSTTNHEPVTKRPSDGNYDDVYARMENATFRCDSTIIGCGDGSDLIWSTIPNESIVTDKCCKNSMLDEDYCFTVDLREAFSSALNVHGHVVAAGAENTAFLLLDPRLTDYMKDVLPGERPGQGFRLHIGVGYDAKYTSKPILISPGSYNLIELSHEVTHTQLAGGWNSLALKASPPCVAKANYSYVLHDTYEKWACEADCQIKREMEVCNCTTVEGDFRRPEIYCWNISMRNFCKRIVSLEKSRPGSVYHRCKTACRDACDWQSITSTVSTTSFPAPSKIEKLKEILESGGRTFSMQDLQRLSLVEIYYGSLFIRYTEVSERTVMNELISYLGGTMAFWTGISIVTIQQAFFYLLWGCWRMIAQKCVCC